MTTKIQTSTMIETFAFIALGVSILGYIGKEIPWGEELALVPKISGYLSFFGFAFLLTDIVLWLKLSNEKLEKLDVVEMELSRLELVLADRAKTNADLEELFKFRSGEVSVHEMGEAWTYLLWRMRKSYRATNYIKNAEIYEMGYAKIALEIQAAKIKAQHVDIKKVFIVDNIQELKKMKTVFQNQHDLGIQVKYILHREIQSKDILKGKACELDTIDFGLIDDRTTLLWLLDDERRIGGGRVLLGRKEFAKYEEFFDALFNEAQKYHDTVMRISPLTADDARTILAWPPYPSEFSALDYALREYGWLNQFPETTGNHRFGAWVDGELVGFSILTQTAPGEAEFYIALNPDKLGQGFGKELTQKILVKGFQDLGFERIHLKVRTWHSRGIHLYEQVGFRKVGEMEMEIMGKKDRFIEMEIRVRTNRYT